MKVFVVIDTGVCDYEFYTDNSRVFKNKSDAIKYAEKQFEYYKDEYPDWENSSTEDSYELWEDGDYTRNHISYFIHECEIE